jgi:microcin C transport system ATP-binding protein
MTVDQQLLSVENFSMAFGRGDAVVDRISFTVSPGEKLAMVGESGSGKSVSALAIMGLHDRRMVNYASDSRIVYAGRNLLALPEAELQAIRGRDIAMIFQEPMTSLNPVYPVGEQLIEPLLVHKGWSRRQAAKHMIDLLHAVEIDRPAERFNDYPHMLSGGQRQRVMIAMALACNPKLLIADEPTTALDVTIQAEVLALLERLQREFNMAVLLISHDLNLVRRYADRILVMKSGEIVEQADTKTLFAAPADAYTRHLLNSQPHGEPVPLGDSQPLLKVQQLACHFPIRKGFLKRTVGVIKAVDAVDVELRTGETVGIVGESGSGKTTLAKCILRLQSCRGEIVFNKHALQGKSQSALRGLRKDMQIVFQDPYSSLSPRMTVQQLLTEGLDVHFPELSKQEKRRRCCQALAEVGLQEMMLSRYPHEFSGGQRQRIAIARVIILKPRLLVLDEPTSALDVSVQSQLLELLKNLQQRYGISYLFISHDLRVIRTIAHRLIVMRQGKIVEQGETRRVFEQPAHAYTRALLAAALLQAN